MAVKRNTALAVIAVFIVIVLAFVLLSSQVTVTERAPETSEPPVTANTGADTATDEDIYTEASRQQAEQQADETAEDGSAPAAAHDEAEEESWQQAEAMRQQAQSPEPMTTEDMLATKALGDPDAPVKIEEFSSLTCGHCGTFHENALEVLKEDYIDTGKLYYVYHEFPLNGPALKAAMLARCMPGKRFWAFTELLFETQANWAYGRDYRDSISQNAKLAGLTGARIDACLENEELAKTLTERMQAFAKKYEINSTPTFVINEGEDKIVGNRSVSVFREAIEKALPEQPEE